MGSSLVVKSWDENVGMGDKLKKSAWMDAPFDRESDYLTKTSTTFHHERRVYVGMESCSTVVILTH